MEIDREVLVESAVARLQSLLQNALAESGLSRRDLAHAMNLDPTTIYRLTGGDYNLKIRALAEALAICGFELEVALKPISQKRVSMSDMQRRQR